MTKQEVVQKLLEDHVGRENCISHSQLAEAIGVSESTVSDIIQDLRSKRELCIGTAKGQPSGNYIIADKEELQQQISVWNREKERITERIEETVEAFTSQELPDTTDVIEQTYACTHAECDREMGRDATFWPDSGDYQDEPLCKYCYGERLMSRES